MPSNEEVRRQLERILKSDLFCGSNQMIRFLRFLVERKLEKPEEALDARSIAVAVFDRPAAHEPRRDPVVRVKIGRLRTKLSDYYRTVGAQDPVTIHLPKGSYIPVFDYRSGIDSQFNGRRTDARAAAGSSQSMLLTTGAPSAEINVDGEVVVLAVSADERDHERLQRFFTHSNWHIFGVHGCEEARKALQQGRFGVVLCDRKLPDGTWRDLLEVLAGLDWSPLLIVAGEDVEADLWAEVLNKGGYDVLSKPFELDEVMRIISLAWLHWRQQLVGTAAANRTQLRA